MLKHHGWRVASVLGSMLFGSAGLHAEQGAKAGDPRWGTSESPVGTNIKEMVSATPVTVTPFASFSNAQYATGGVGLRNLGTGTLQISGVITPVQAAYLYWAVITQGGALPADRSVTLTQTFPAGASETITGTLIAIGNPPCWGGDRISVFRGTVPVGDVSGNGSYQVAFTGAGASGSTAGEDPWTAATLPLLEGASLVVVGTGTGEVSIFDKGISAKTFGVTANPGTFTYTLNLPTATTGNQVLFDNIGADGQIGASRSADYQDLAEKKTVINGLIEAGPFTSLSAYIDFDSDWNGDAATPLPRLWDDVGHDITNAAPSGTTLLTVSVTTHGDCLTPVANVVAAF